MRNSPKYMKDYQKKNHKAISKYQSNWYQDNHEEVSGKQANYYKKNRKKILERVRIYGQSETYKTWSGVVNIFRVIGIYAFSAFWLDCVWNIGKTVYQGIWLVKYEVDKIE